MFSRLTIPGSLLAEVVAHARRDLPNECCGLLAGRLSEGTGVVSARFAIGNDAASPTEYETNARDLLAAFRAMRASGDELLAIYHSHPTSPPVPSKKDLVMNWSTEVVNVIVSLITTPPTVRAWWLTDVDYREAEWKLE